MSMLETLRSELGLARRAITRMFLVALLVSGTAFVVLFNIAVLKDGVDSVVDAVVKVGVAFGFAVTYAVTLALVVAAIALGWHLFGAFLALPFVLTPLLLLLVFWLGGGLVHSFAGDLLQARQRGLSQRLPAMCSRRSKHRRRPRSTAARSTVFALRTQAALRRLSSCW